jgi:uncharacterized membrane protein
VAAVLVARICATVALMGSLHAAVMIGHPELSLAPLPLFFLVQGLAEDHHSGGRPRWGRILLCAAVTGIIVWAAQDHPGFRRSPYLLPVLINVFLLVQFGRTLLPGREPLIVRYCRTDLGAVPAAVERYARRLTALWCIVFAGMIAEGAILAEYASIELWSLFANVLNYVLVFALFVGEHAVRSVIFPEYGIASPIRTGRAMLRSSLGAAPGV